MGDTSVLEGDRGRRDAVFTVELSRALTHDVTVCLAPYGITAWPLLDFDLRLPCGRLGAGTTTIDLAIPVKGDRQREADETFGVLAAAIAGVDHEDPLAVATIVDDDR